MPEGGKHHARPGPSLGACGRRRALEGPPPLLAPFGRVSPSVPPASPGAPRRSPGVHGARRRSARSRIRALRPGPSSGSGPSHGPAATPSATAAASWAGPGRRGPGAGGEAERGGDGGGREGKGRRGSEPLPPPSAGARKRRHRPGTRLCPPGPARSLPRASRAAASRRVRCLLRFSTQYSYTIFPAVSLLSHYGLVSAVIRGLRCVSSGTISPYVPSGHRRSVIVDQMCNSG